MMNCNVRLINIEGIKIGDLVIPRETIEADAKRLAGKTFLVGIGRQHFSLTDEALLRVFCFEYMPFTLMADEGAQVWLRAEIRRYPYSINGEQNFQAFACRLVPEAGRIAHLVSTMSSGLAINGFDLSPRRVAWDLGNGAIYLEVYFEPHPLESLSELRPPQGYRAEVVLPDDPLD